MLLQINKFESRKALIASLTADVLKALSSGIGNRSVASMLLAGGSTPGPFYEHLSRSEEHTSELQSRSDLVCRLLLEKKKIKK